jgi:hypothetical protein
MVAGRCFQCSATGDLGEEYEAGDQCVGCGGPVVNGGTYDSAGANLGAPVGYSSVVR